MYFFFSFSFLIIFVYDYRLAINNIIIRRVNFSFIDINHRVPLIRYYAITIVIICTIVILCLKHYYHNKSASDSRRSTQYFDLFVSYVCKYCVPVVTSNNGPCVSAKARVTGRPRSGSIWSDEPVGRAPGSSRGPPAPGSSHWPPAPEVGVPPVLSIRPLPWIRFWKTLRWGFHRWSRWASGSELAGHCPPVRFDRKPQSCSSYGNRKSKPALAQGNTRARGRGLLAEGLFFLPRPLPLTGNPRARHCANRPVTIGNFTRTLPNDRLT